MATSDAATRDLLRKALHVRAVEVVEATDGVEALALARRLEVDLVVLDAFLAVIDGISVCGRIRGLVGLSQPGILILGVGSERTVELAYAQGADEILTKPLAPGLIRQRVEALLRRRDQEKRLRLLERAIDATDVSLTIMDARSSEYPLVYANPAFMQTTGYSAEELLGRNLRLLRGPETDVAAMTELRDAFAEGHACRVLLKNYRKDGSTFWNDVAVTPMADSSGRVTHYVGAQSEVSDGSPALRTVEASQQIESMAAERTHMLEAVLARVEDRRRFIETILNGMAAGLITTAPDRTVSFANRAALRTLGVSTADCIGKPLVDLFGGGEELRDVVEAETGRPETRLDFPFISPGGARLYVGLSIWRVPEELQQELGIVVLFRDLAETLDRGETVSSTLQMGPRGSDPEVGLGGDEGGGVLRPPHVPQPWPAGDLVQEAVGRVAAETHDGGIGDVSRLDDLPSVLVDKDQVVDALTRLMRNAVHRCGRPERVRVRVEPTHARAERGTADEAFVRVDVIFPREEMPDASLGAAEVERRRQRRSQDLAMAEQLLLANGGRMVAVSVHYTERSLSALLPAAP